MNCKYCFWFNTWEVNSSKCDCHLVQQVNFFSIYMSTSSWVWGPSSSGSQSQDFKKFATCVKEIRNKMCLPHTSCETSRVDGKKTGRQISYLSVSDLIIQVFPVTETIWTTPKKLGGNIPHKYKWSQGVWKRSVDLLKTLLIHGVQLLWNDNLDENDFLWSSSWMI